MGGVLGGGVGGYSRGDCCDSSDKGLEAGSDCSTSAEAWRTRTPWSVLIQVQRSNTLIHWDSDSKVTLLHIGFAESLRLWSEYERGIIFQR